jgi:hypothetical protein
MVITMITAMPSCGIPAMKASAAAVQNSAAKKWVNSERRCRNAEGCLIVGSRLGPSRARSRTASTDVRPAGSPGCIATLPPGHASKSHENSMFTRVVRVTLTLLGGIDADPFSPRRPLPKFEPRSQNDDNRRIIMELTPTGTRLAGKVALITGGARAWARLMRGQWSRRVRQWCSAMCSTRKGARLLMTSDRLRPMCIWMSPIGVIGPKRWLRRSISTDTSTCS